MFAEKNYYNHFTSLPLLGRQRPTGTSMWIAIVALVAFVVVLLIWDTNNENKRTESERRSTDPSFCSSYVQTLQQCRSPSNIITPLQSKGVKGSARRVSRSLDLRDSSTLPIYSGVTVSLRQNVQLQPFAVMPLSNLGCTQYVVDSGVHANQVQTVPNSLVQLAWNNLNSTYLQTGSNATSPPAFTPLTTTPGHISFQQCTGGLSTNNVSLGLTADYPATYAFTFENPTIACGSVQVLSSVTIPQDTFLIRLYYAASSPTRSVTQSNVIITGVLNGVDFSSLTPVSLGGAFPYSITQYVPVSTVFTSSVNQSAGTTCATIAQLTSPKVQFQAVITDSSTSQNTIVQQTIDLLQLGYAVPPIGTWIVADTPFFVYNNNPQNVVWLNDAINWYDLPSLTTKGPGRKVHLEPRMLPQNAELFSSPSAFTAWKTKYGVTYTTATEHVSRYEIYKQNVARASQLNVQQPRARFGATKFADLTVAELHRDHIGPLGLPTNVTPRSISKQQFLAGRKKTTPAPAAWDWRDHNAVTDVKNQGVYGTCWAFAATGAIEGQCAIQSGNLVSFSEQQLIDCSNTLPDMRMFAQQNSLNYIVSLSAQNGGAMPLASYPYVGNAGPCQYVPPASAGVYGQIGSWAILPQIAGYTPEDALANYLYEIGPLSIGIDIDDLVGLYTEGIIDPQSCSGQSGHAVLLVGYGDLCGTPYWIIKNCWGVDLGVDGYIYLERTPGNQGQAKCNINNGVVAAFSATAIPSFVTPLSLWQGGMLQPNCCARGVNLIAISFIDSATIDCESYTFSAGGLADTAIPFGTNTLQYNDWTSTLPGPSPAPSHYWAVPFSVSTVLGSTVTFNSCTQRSGASCASLGSLTLPTDTSSEFTYVIGSGSPSNCTVYSISVPTSIAVPANSFACRVVPVPDPSRTSALLQNCTVTLLGYTGSVPSATNSVSTYAQVTQSEIANYTPSPYVNLGTTFTSPYDASNVYQLSLKVDVYYTNGVSLSITKPISQRFYFVPPLATILVQPSFASSSLSIVTLNDAINFFYNTSLY